MRNTNKREKVEIILEYSGIDVDDGTMSLEDMVPALQGFSSAYGKIASLLSLETQHKLRVTGVKRGSFHILLEAWNTLSTNKDQLSMVGDLAAITPVGVVGAYKIVSWIIGVIKATKHTQRKPYTEKINPEDRTVVITNHNNVLLEVPLEVFKIYKDGLISQDLNKITRPLEEDKIKSTNISAKSGSKTEGEDIDLDQKQFFDVEEIIVTETKEMWLTGILNSLTKTTNRGYFYLNDGTRTTYHLASNNPELMYRFFIMKGPVKLRCKASLDENLKPTQIEVYQIVPIQEGLFEKEKRNT